MLASPCIIVHGGVRDAAKDPMTMEKVASCRKSACIGYDRLLNGGTAVEAVEAALRWLEDDELFNCGYGSLLNQIGKVEMDSSITNGRTGECGSVVAISTVDHPISVARHVLEHSANSIFCGKAAAKLAQSIDGVVTLSKLEMISPAARAAFASASAGIIGSDDECSRFKEQEDKEAVGCVAWDGLGVASGSSTGGLNGKSVGRVGDSGLLGCGIFADGQFGCSLTGHGESLLGLGLARQIGRRHSRTGSSAFGALKAGLERLQLSTGGTAGGVGLDGSNGDWATYFTGSHIMPFAYVDARELHCGTDVVRTFI